MTVRPHPSGPAAALAAAVFGFTLFGGPSNAAAKKPGAKAPAKAPKQSTAKFCAAAKAWLKFETATLASGPYDEAWVRETKRLIVPVAANAPKTLRSSAAIFAFSLMGDRSEIAGVANISQEDDVYWLREFAADETSLSSITARDAVGSYVLNACKIDVLKPFRDVAKGFE